MPGVFNRGGLVYLETNDRMRFVYDERKPPLGSGAMGDVYEGLVYNTKNRVAIKKVKDQFANIPEIRRRAHQEASLMFRHRNLIEMLGYCETNPNSGPLYIISNFVQGTNIDKFIQHNLKRDANFVKKVCELIFPVFDALTYIHANKIWHMDIKPSNIMVEHGNNVRLMDLGIVQVSQSSNTHASGLMGTPSYAAPEQFMSKDSRSNRVNGKTDLYELGVTIYELLTGKNPFSADSISEAKRRHMSIVLPDDPIIPGPVLNVLRKATSSNPEDRYSTASEMKLALRSSIYKPAPNPSRNIVIISIFAVVVIVLMITLLVNYIS